MASARSEPVLPARYTILRHVADGGMASVWEARDERLRRSVAVKVLESLDAAASERFAREARSAARLSSHPHVVTVNDVGEFHGTAFLVMAFHGEGTVADVLKSGPVASAVALRWLADAGSALDAAHAAGIVHRDVKPGNLLLDGHGGVAVGDFGIARAAWESGLTQTGLVLGTAAYLSPEQRAGEPASPASDRYALGLLARELLTGARPGAPDHDRPLPDTVKAVLRRACASDPTLRPRSSAALVAELEDALQDADTGAVAFAPRARVGPSRPSGAPAPSVRAVPPAGSAAARVPRPPRGGAGGARRGSERGGAATGLGAGGPAARAGVHGAALAPASTGRSGGAGRRTGGGTGGGDPRGGGPGGRGPGAPAGTRAAREGRREPRRRSDGLTRALALLGAAAVVVALGALAAFLLTRDTDGTAARTGADAATTAPHHPTASVASTTTPPSTTQPPASTDGAATDAADRSSALNDRGKALADQGEAGQAVPILRQAVSGLCRDESDVRCLYALFNLARAMRLNGMPTQAILVLDERLRIDPDDQAAAVADELALDREAVGGTLNDGDSASPDDQLAPDDGGDPDEPDDSDPSDDGVDGTGF